MQLNNIRSYVMLSLCMIACQNCRSQCNNNDEERKIFFVDSMYNSGEKNATLDSKNDCEIYSLILNQIDKLQPLQVVPKLDPKYGFVNFSIEATKKQYTIIYTLYDGVIIQESFTNHSKKYYRNIDLELVISYYLTR